MSKGINAWAKELKHNESFAKKYEGVKTVEDIINVAKTQGYDISRRELQELDFDAIAGGFGGPKVNASAALVSAVASSSMTAIGAGGGTATTQGTQTQTQTQKDLGYND